MNDPFLHILCEKNNALLNRFLNLNLTFCVHVLDNISYMKTLKRLDKNITVIENLSDPDLLLSNNIKSIVVSAESKDKVISAINSALDCFKLADGPMNVFTNVRLTSANNYNFVSNSFANVNRMLILKGGVAANKSIQFQPPPLKKSADGKKSVVEEEQPITMTVVELPSVGEIVSSVFEKPPAAIQAAITAVTEGPYFIHFPAKPVESVNCADVCPKEQLLKLGLTKEDYDGDKFFLWANDKFVHSLTLQQASIPGVFSTDSFRESAQMLQEKFAHPLYYRIDGRPVFFVMNTFAIKNIKEFYAILDEMAHPIILVNSFETTPKLMIQSASVPAPVSVPAVADKGRVGKFTKPKAPPSTRRWL